MNYQASPSSSGGDGDDAPTSHEHASKRRRLNSATLTLESRQGQQEPTASVQSLDGWPVSERDYVEIVSGSGSAPRDHQLRPSNSLPIDHEQHPLPLQVPPRREHELPFGLREADVADPRAPRTAYSSSGAQADYSVAGDHNLPFGMLYNPQLSNPIGDASNPALLTTERDSDQQDLDGLHAIDLTGVIDGATLRQREALDEDERRARRERSMKIEARRKANAQMLKSSLEQQQADPANLADSSSSKGLGNMQCVICMDNFTDMTATHCGHLFCHTCINEHLITAEMGRGHSSTKALCPFCRTPVHRAGRRAGERQKGIVPLVFKVKPRSGQGTPTDKQRQVENVD